MTNACLVIIIFFGEATAIVTMMAITKLINYIYVPYSSTNFMLSQPEAHVWHEKHQSKGTCKCGLRKINLPHIIIIYRYKIMQNALVLVLLLL